VPLLFIVSALTFVLVSLTPGDPAREILGTQGTPEQYANLHRELGLDLPLYEQYWRWASHALTGNFGTSLFSGQSVAQGINDRLSVTLWLTIGSLVVSLIVGVGLGLFSAVRGGALGRVVDGLALVGFALPAFWAGALLIACFAIRLGWLPATGYVSPADSLGEWLRTLALPVAALSLHGIAGLAKQTREAMLDVLGSEHIRSARANGLSESSIILRHALKYASVRIVTVLGLQAILLLSGTVVIENVFALPGLGSLAVAAMNQHDLPVIQGVVVYFTVMVVVVNLMTDVAYTLLNPKVGTK
jgi:peptide/nickel transport system permease protein